MLCSLLLPPLVIGLLLIFMVGPYTAIGQVLGRVHLSATNTFLALVIAEVYESAPYYVLAAQAAFRGVDRELEQQAGLLGDRPARVFRRVTLPLALPGLATALAVAWAQGNGRLRSRDNHRLPPFRDTVADLYHSAGDRPGLSLTVRFGPISSCPSATTGGLCLERPCWTPTSRLSGAISRCAPLYRWGPANDWLCSGHRVQARQRCSR